MIKKYIQFIKEEYEYEGEQPGPNEPGCVKISLDSIDEFGEDPALSKLVSDGKVALYNGEVWYHQTDTKTAELLNQYFGDQMEKNPIGWDEENESIVNEGKVSDMKKEIQNRIEIISMRKKQISKLQDDCDEMEDKIHKLELKIEKEKRKKEK